MPDHQRENVQIDVTYF